MTTLASHDDQPIIQIGLLWFDPDGGADIYLEYLAASKPFMEKYLGRPFVAEGYERLATLSGDLDPDFVAINEFPNAGTIEALRNDPEYPRELLRRATTRVEIIQLRKD